MSGPSLAPIGARRAARTVDGRLCGCVATRAAPAEAEAAQAEAGGAAHISASDAGVIRPGRAPPPLGGLRAHITRVYSRRRAYLVPCRASAGMRGSGRQPWNCMETGASPRRDPAGAGDPLFPVLVADYFIANARGPLTPLQVIKMVYIAHGYSLAILGEPLVEEAVEAWRYGPVLPSVYYAAKRYGGDGITRLLYLWHEDGRRGRAWRAQGSSLGAASRRGREPYWTGFLTCTAGSTAAS